MQPFTYLSSGNEYAVELPPCDAEVISGVQWGGPCELFTPAYWYTQYLMRTSRDNEFQHHRIGRTFSEELTACVLGGHGITAEIGIAAFQRLKEHGVISGLCADRELIEKHLREPLTVRGRMVTYRFWSQKATYLAAIFARLRIEDFPMTDGRVLRDRLLLLPGIGPNRFLDRAQLARLQRSSDIGYSYLSRRRSGKCLRPKRRRDKGLSANGRAVYCIFHRTRCSYLRTGCSDMGHDEVDSTASHAPVRSSRMASPETHPAPSNARPVANGVNGSSGIKDSAGMVPVRPRIRNASS